MNDAALTFYCNTFSKITLSSFGSIMYFSCDLANNDFKYGNASLVQLAISSYGCILAITIPSHLYSLSISLRESPKSI